MAYTYVCATHFVIYLCYNCTGVLRERVESARLTLMIVGFPGPLITEIVSCMTAAFTVSYT